MSEPQPVGGPRVPIWTAYSVAERDRRWNTVRANAARAGLDCVFVPIGNGIDARYLTGLRSSSIVIPTEGRAPIVIADRGASNAWVPGPRLTSRDWAEPMAQALLDAGMERGWVGVSGLKGGKVTHVRSYDGVVAQGAYAHVLARLPNATFVDATDVVGFARYVKSDEEIEALRRSTAIAEAAIDELVQQARPGVDAAVLYARVTGRMLRLGSEHYPLALTIDHFDTREPARYTSPPLGRRLQPNDLITSEASASWSGQQCQEDQPVLLGGIPDAWKPVIDLQHEVFEAGLALMKPGTSFAEMIDSINGFSARRGMRTAILMHGRGYGDDGPLISPRASGEQIRDVRVERGNAWVWKPTAYSADGRIAFTWGGDVIVTDRGGEALFKRPHGLVSIE